MASLVRRTAVVLSAGAALSFGVGAPASAQPLVITGGLVNVTIVDAVDIGDVVVQLPISVAANVCDVEVQVLVADLADDGEANCTATAPSGAQA